MYPDCLRDESRRVGAAASVSFPLSERDIIDHVAEARRLGRSVTVQGARTGIAAGAVPDGGHALNLSRMNRIIGLAPGAARNEWLLRVQPGVVLSDLQNALLRRRFDAAEWSREDAARCEPFAAGPAFFFPPDPTETSASIGGMAACNASGAKSLRYGATRAYVHAARLVLADGSVLALQRGRERCRGRDFAVAASAGRTISGSVPSYRMPAVKNAAGYYAADDMDLLDVFIGSDGTLGLFSELTLRLIPSPAAQWGIMAFLGAVDDVAGLVGRVRSAEHPPAAMEYFDGNSLALLRAEKSRNATLAGIPDLPPGARSALYVEYHGADEESVESAAVSFSDMLAGLTDTEPWVAADHREMARLKSLRHAVPESVNMLIDERRKTEPSLTKLGTDIAVPDSSLAEMLRTYETDLREASLEWVAFGHVGNNHLHVNILPRNLDDYKLGREIHTRWARKAVGLGGSVSAEHGIGKLKKELLRIMYGDDGIGQMRRLRLLFDPDGVFGPGNLF